MFKKIYSYRRNKMLIWQMRLKLNCKNEKDHFWSLENNRKACLSRRWRWRKNMKQRLVSSNCKLKVSFLLILWFVRVGNSEWVITIDLEVKRLGNFCLQITKIPKRLDRRFLKSGSRPEQPNRERVTNLARLHRLIRRQNVQSQRHLPRSAQATKSNRIRSGTLKSLHIGS